MRRSFYRIELPQSIFTSRCYTVAIKRANSLGYKHIIAAKKVPITKQLAKPIESPFPSILLRDRSRDFLKISSNVLPPSLGWEATVSHQSHNALGVFVRMIKCSAILLAYLNSVWMIKDYDWLRIRWNSMIVDIDSVDVDTGSKIEVFPVRLELHQLQIDYHILWYW